MKLADRFARWFLDTPQGIAVLLFGASLILSFQADLWSP
jgi:hypothetical protein